MLQDALTLYKLIVLYMLNRVPFPLTVAQISDFVLEKEYTNFMTLQTAIGELIDAGMVKSQSTANRTNLTITPEGQQTLDYFGNRIGTSIRQEIDSYLTENGLSLRNEVAIQGSFYKSTSGEYEAHLTAKDTEIVMVDIKLSVPTLELAKNICDNWQEKNETIYQYLIQQLF